MAKQNESTKQEAVEAQAPVEGLTAEQLAAERVPGSPDTEAVVVNQQELAAGQPPAKNYPASDAYVASITPPGITDTAQAAADAAPGKTGKEWWVDGAGEAWRRDQIIGVSIPKTGRAVSTDRIAIRLATGAVVHVPVSDPAAARDELLK